MNVWLFEDALTIIKNCIFHLENPMNNSFSLLNSYFSRLYRRTMHSAYEQAYEEIALSLMNGGKCLDCGASGGHHFGVLHGRMGLEQKLYTGIEWDAESVSIARKKGVNVVQGDLNELLPYEDESFQAVYGLSLLEHLLNGCQWIREVKRVLIPGGKIVVLTPNISTFFTMALLLAGKMPSSGPHPDSEVLQKNEMLFNVREMQQADLESDTPVHRHLVVFSYRALQTYLQQLGFVKINGYGFGLYPFPNFLQPLLEKIDPWHCHQMVFSAEKQR
ncbi:MAG: class I SAM-dependent methyltransferase [Candidatus Electrothrix sp. AR4]|nr:class I SAM-dependent methyltransferase [Candidatus Electrothrix sp. AR4]